MRLSSDSASSYGTIDLRALVPFACSRKSRFTLLFEVTRLGLCEFSPRDFEPALLKWLTLRIGYYFEPKLPSAVQYFS